jgi:hypothetical protein
VLLVLFLFLLKRERGEEGWKAPSSINNHTRFVIIFLYIRKDSVEWGGGGGYEDSNLPFPILLGPKLAYQKIKIKFRIT